MKKYLWFGLVFIVLIYSALVFAKSDEWTSLGMFVVLSMADSDFASVEKRFDDAMKEALPQGKLQETWQAMVAQSGSFKRMFSVNSEVMNEYHVVAVTCQFEKITADIEITFNSYTQISGLYLNRSQMAAQINRPQEPVRPYPYYERAATFNNPKSKVKLAGILTLPKLSGKAPAVLLISGAGQQDRDETMLEHKPFLVLADYLTRRGIAVLRIDDEGIGGSTGNYATATSEDLVGDVSAGIAYLKKYPEIDSQRIGLIGYGEGSLIAAMVAIKSKDVAFMLLLAGSGTPGEQILADQLTVMLKASGKSNQIIKREQVLQKNLLAIVKQEKDNSLAESKMRAELTRYIDNLSAEEKKALSDPEAFIKQQVQSALTPWMRFYITYDPRLALSQVKCPVLAINGGKDTQVLPTENLAAIKVALQKGANQDYTVKELPKLNHLLQTCNTGLMNEYGAIEETIAPEALNLIGDWIESHMKIKKSSTPAMP